MGNLEEIVALINLEGCGVLPQSAIISHEHTYSPLFRYPWPSVSNALDAMAPAADGSRRIRYVNPVDGGPVMPTIDCYAERFEVGRPTQPTRASYTAIVAVVDGEGSTRVGAKQFTWKKHDIFTLPRWQWIEHTANAGPASLFLMTDLSFVASIGQLREEKKAPGQ